MGYTRSYFVTAQQAARRMVGGGSGVIMTVSAPPARQGATLLGGHGPAQAAKEALTVFMASDRASGMTGTTVNLTMGTLDD